MLYRIWRGGVVCESMARTEDCLSTAAQERAGRRGSIAGTAVYIFLGSVKVACEYSCDCRNLCAVQQIVSIQTERQTSTDLTTRLAPEGPQGAYGPLYWIATSACRK